MESLFPTGTKIPNHLAIIPDGDRRWAKLHHLPTIKGHQKGFRVLLEIARAARNWGIHTVTIWIFSTENWKRTKEEVKYLMKIEEEMLKKYLPEAQKDGVRIIHLGRKDRIPKSFARALKNAEEQTRINAEHILNIAVDYGGRDEIIRAIAKFMQAKKPDLRVPPSAGPNSRNLERSIPGIGASPDEDEFARYLDTCDQPYPYPDLLIRTSGEMRTSGFLPWQMAYTEFYFIKKHLPDCTVEDLKEAILEYNRRQRRFGGN